MTCLGGTGEKGGDVVKKTNHNQSLTDEVVTVAPAETDEAITLRMDVCREELEIGLASDIGRREYQQDAAKTGNDYEFVLSNRAIAVLCDGMGGLNGGERASKLCADLVYEGFHDLPEDADIHGYLLKAVDQADQAVSDLRDETGTPLHAGTTLIAVAIRGNEMYWASVGDSRIYILRGKDMEQATQDHNYLMILQQRVMRGELSYEEASSDPKREALVSYIGMGGVRYVDCNPEPLHLQDGDVVLICSDGLYRTLTKGEMQQIILNSEVSMEQTAEELVRRALEKKLQYQDNLTVILLRYKEQVSNPTE